MEEEDYTLEVRGTIIIPVEAEWIEYIENPHYPNCLENIRDGRIYTVQELKKEIHRKNEIIWLYNQLFEGAIDK